VRPFDTLVLLALAQTLGCAGARVAPSVDPPADAAVSEGQRSLKVGRSDEALASFRKALAKDPQHRPAMRSLVEAHFRTGRVDLIIRELEERVTRDPSDHLAHYGLGLALFARAADTEGKAVVHLGRAVALRPEIAEYHFRLGVVHLEAERFPEAAMSLVQARDREPDVARHYVPLALALSRTGDRKGALDALRAILTRAPVPQDLEVARRVMLRLTDPFREFPKAVEGEFTRGLDFMERLDSPQQAIVTFEELLEKFPDIAVVHAALGLCYLRLDDAGRAMDSFRRALELAPEDARTHQYIGDLYFARERFDKAVEAYEASLLRDPLNDHAYERLGQIALQRGDPATAARWLKVLVVLRPADPSARGAYGRALLGANDPTAAEREFKAILESDPTNVEALLRMGLVTLERRNGEKDPARRGALAEQAARYFESVLDLQPQNVYAARMLKEARP
jgi:tetratricopeptide (TPR) repeat protein